jgi:hypothetical protein
MKHITILILFIFVACKSDKNEDSYEVKTVSVAEASIDDALADSLIMAFKKRILLEDMKFLADDTTKFQIYKIDINSDQQEEIFVRFMSPYFCAGIGCDLMIFDAELNLLNRFTATSVPIIATQEFQNGWRVLLTKVSGESKMLINKNDRYPSNPSMAPPSNIEVSEGAIIMFDDTNFPAKTYSF